MGHRQNCAGHNIKVNCTTGKYSQKKVQFFLHWDLGKWSTEQVKNNIADLQPTNPPTRNVMSASPAHLD